jgi:RNA polymerase sigma-70 factor (ECF subfamily)
MYAFGIARLVQLEGYREQSRFKVVEDEAQTNEESVGSIEDQSLEQSDLARLRLAIQKLPEPQRQIVLLHTGEEFSLQKISESLGIPLNTVKSHIHRAKEFLRLEMVEERI